MCRRRPCRHWLRPVASRRCCCFFSSSHTHSSSSLPLLLLRSCASAVKLIQSRIRHKQKHQQQCVVRCVVAVELLRLPLPLLPSLLIDTKKMKFKRGGSDAHVSFRFVLSASVGEDDPRGDAALAVRPRCCRCCCCCRSLLTRVGLETRR